MRETASAKNSTRLGPGARKRRWRRISSPWLAALLLVTVLQPFAAENLAAQNLTAEPLTTQSYEAPPAELIIPFELDEEISGWVQRIAPADHSPLRRLRSITQALLDPQRIGLQEDLERTPTAVEAFRTRRANCVGYAALFVALARHAGVPAFFVMVEDLGKSRRQGSLRITEGHLAAAHGSPRQLKIFDFAGESDGGDYRVLPVTDLTAIALFYSNRGVESMINNQTANAIGWLRQATELAPALAPAWINLGVALRRTGELEDAEAAYQAALRADPGAVIAYQSLAALLRLQGRLNEADSLLDDAAHLATDDALGYLTLARRSLRTGDVDEARNLYRKALELSRRGR